MEKIKEWKAENLGARVTYGPDRHNGNNAVAYGLRPKAEKIIGLEPWTVFQPLF